MTQYTLSYALELWRNSREGKEVDPNFEKYLSLALRRYVFPKLTPALQTLPASEFPTHCETVPVENLKEALSIFEHQFGLAVKNGQISQTTGHNYRSALRRFIEWLQKQAWWQGLLPDPVVRVAPPPVKVNPKPGTGVKTLCLYGLAIEDLPDHLHGELEAFRQFRLTGGSSIRRTLRESRRHREDGEARRPKMDPVKPSTFKNDEAQILAFLGWYTEYQLLSEEHLKLLSDINQVLKSQSLFALVSNFKQRYLFQTYLSLLKEFRNKLLAELHLSLLTDPDLLWDSTYWAIETRGVSHCYGVNLAKTSIAIAKWINYDKSTRRNWSDVPVILELKDIRNEFAEEYASEKRELDEKKWSIKELTHEEARKVVEYLRLCCAPRYRSHNKKTGTHKYSQKRKLSAVARAWQTYLLVKILVYCPVRQEEIRNWKLDETLFRQIDENGNSYYVVYLKEHKRSTTNKDRHYRLPAILTKDLDLWIYKWRPLIENTIRDPEKWLSFWGYRVNEVEMLEARLAAAKKGKLSKTVKNTQERYITELENRLEGIKRRIKTWEVAQQNFEQHNFLFFKFGKNGKNDTQSFGQPQEVASVWRVVVDAIARSTKALFGEERWTNPQKLRNIAEKHIRQSGKLDIADAFATFIGHSKEMGDEYAEQITSEYELTEDIVDNWWHEEVVD